MQKRYRVLTQRYKVMFTGMNCLIARFVELRLKAPSILSGVI
jgi:hypothetical protein